MQTAKPRRLSRGERRGVALIIMVLLIVVFCTIIWLDPFAMIKGSDAGMPWNEEDRLVRPDEEVPSPKQEQPEILYNLQILAEAAENGEARGGVRIYILTDGRVKGGWAGTYNPEPKVMWEAASSGFKGNIDPSKIYSDESGEDRSKLYFIARGNFLILETNSDTGIVRSLKGKIYATGWLDSEYNAVGEIVITSDKKSYKAYRWRGTAEEAKFIPDFGGSLFKMVF